MSEPTQTTADRHELTKKLMSLPVKNGDVIYRKSDAKGPWGLPFCRLVAKATNAVYTHAAILFWEDKQLCVLEVSDTGTVLYRFLDWVDFCLDEDFVIYRHKDLTPFLEKRFYDSIMDFLDLDPSYDFTFSSEDKFYCSESVCYIYEEMGISICSPKLIKDIVSSSAWLKIRVGNWLYSKIAPDVCLNLEKPMYFVGNETNDGMMASKTMSKVFYSLD